MASIRFIGGFLGSGKTTAILRLALAQIDQGKRVGVITNDQSESLVDTEMFRIAGIPVAEVARGCFCCKFDAFVAAAGELMAARAPDVIYAEPVGSCTDIVATVIRPLRLLHGDHFRVAPYVALLDPQRAREVLESPRAGPAWQRLTERVTYIYRLQQQEAQLIALSKIDTLSGVERETMARLVAKHFPRSRAISTSARTGEGFQELERLLESGAFAQDENLDVDYDVYADGEARLGWLNATADVAARDDLDGDVLALALVASLREEFRRDGIEPAHLKVMLVENGRSALANLVSGESQPVLSQSAGGRMIRPRLLINARVETVPQQLKEIVERVCARVGRDQDVSIRFAEQDALSPGRPVPSHRVLA